MRSLTLPTILAFLTSALLSSALLSSALLIGCGGKGGGNPIGAPVSDDERTTTDELYTGRFKNLDPEQIIDDVPEDEVPYTISGDVETYKSFSTRTGKINSEFTNAIKKISLVQKEISNDPVLKSAPTSNIKVFKIRFKPNYKLQTLEFEIDQNELLQKLAYSTQASKILPNTNNNPFALDIVCSNKTCANLELIVSDSSDKSQVQAGILYHLQNVKLRISGKDLNEFKSKKLFGKKADFVVVSGPSFASIQILEISKGKNSNTETILLSLETEVLETSTGATRVRGLSGELAKKYPAMVAALVGNNPETGDLVFDIQLKTSDINSEFDPNIRISLVGDRTSKINPEQTTAKEKYELQKTNMVFNPNKISKHIDYQTKLFNQYWDNVEVQKRIYAWQNSESPCRGCSKLSRERAQQFIELGKTFSPVIQAVAKDTDQTPESAYILALESNFLVDPSLPVQVTAYNPKSCKACTAAGPWQMIYSTAAGIIQNFNLPFAVYDIQGQGSNRRLNPRDDRGYLKESTYMALLYLRTLQKKFPKDIGLSILAYHLGGGATENGLKKLVRDSGKFADLSLDELISKKMIRDPVGFGNYVYSILALRFIGNSPESYGFKIPIDPIIPASAKNKITNPYSLK